MKAKKKTEDQARSEFNQLMYDDDEFIAQWGEQTLEEQENAFYEWCSNCDHLKHIKKRGI